MSTANGSPYSAMVAVEAEEMAAKAAHKRYERLMMVRTKAILRKGAWYWAHLEPILIQSFDTGVPNAVKLRCCLCRSLFSASNPSRTASEHLKRGTCPNFAFSSAAAATELHHHLNPVTPIAHQSNSRKRSYQIAPLAVVDPFGNGGGNVVHYTSSTPPLPPLLTLQPPHLAIPSGKLKSPKDSPVITFSNAQVESAKCLLSDWFYESAAPGGVSFSSVEHPKFRAFLNQVGVPPITRRELAGARLNARYADARSHADARISDSLFFQVAADGWNPLSFSGSHVSIIINLPNGIAVFRRALLTHRCVSSNYAEEVLWETVTDVCGGGTTTRCAGIVSGRFKDTALRSLESQNQWMVNLSCQLHAFRSLIKHFTRGLSLFHSVTKKISKIASFFNHISPARTLLHKYQLQELDRASLLRCTLSSTHINFPAMLEDVMTSARPLQLAVHDDSYELLCLEEPDAKELAETISDDGFWNDLHALHSLTKLINNMIHDMESSRPLVGQCLPLWEELRSKLKNWCIKYIVNESVVFKVFDDRFKKNYHPAWAAAFILDPLNLIKDSISGKYLPPYDRLTPEQEKDVDKVITRLAPREEAHIVLNELMKWRSDGMDPLYAQAVQEKQVDLMTGKMRFVNPQGNRLVWETCLSEEFGSLAKVVVRLVFLHATASCGFRCSLSMVRSREGMERAQKMIFVAANSKLERRDFSNEEEKDAVLFVNGEDDALDETFLHASFL